MRVEVKLLLIFKERSPDGRPTIHLELASGTTVAGALACLPIPTDAPKVVLLNGRLAADAQVLRDGDQLTIFPPLEGG